MKIFKYLVFWCVFMLMLITVQASGSAGKKSHPSGDSDEGSNFLPVDASGDDVDDYNSEERTMSGASLTDEEHHISYGEENSSLSNGQTTDEQESSEEFEIDLGSWQFLQQKYMEESDISDYVSDESDSFGYDSDDDSDSYSNEDDDSDTGDEEDSESIDQSTSTDHNGGDKYPKRGNMIDPYGGDKYPQKGYIIDPYGGDKYPKKSYIIDPYVGGKEPEKGPDPHGITEPQKVPSIDPFEGAKDPREGQVDAGETDEESLGEFETPDKLKNPYDALFGLMGLSKEEATRRMEEGRNPFKGSPFKGEIDQVKKEQKEKETTDYSDDEGSDDKDMDYSDASGGMDGDDVDENNPFVSLFSTVNNPSMMNEKDENNEGDYWLSLNQMVE